MMALEAQRKRPGGFVKDIEVRRLVKFPQVSGSRLLRALEGDLGLRQRQTGGHAIIVHREDPNEEPSFHYMEASQSAEEPYSPFLDGLDYLLKQSNRS